MKSNTCHAFEIKHGTLPPFPSRSRIASHIVTTCFCYRCDVVFRSRQNIDSSVYEIFICFDSTPFTHNTQWTWCPTQCKYAWSGTVAYINKKKARRFRARRVRVRVRLIVHTNMHNCWAYFGAFATFVTAGRTVVCWPCVIIINGNGGGGGGAIGFDPAKCSMQLCSVID